MPEQRIARMSEAELLANAEEIIEAASEKLSKLCKGDRWHMSIPVDDDDSDIVLGAVIRLARSLVGRAASGVPTSTPTDLALAAELMETAVWIAERESTLADAQHRRHVSQAIQRLRGEKEGSVLDIRKLLLTDATCAAIAEYIRQESRAASGVTPRVTPIEIDLHDVEFHHWPPTRTGGQHTSRTSSGILVIHRPTGIAVFYDLERSQMQNRKVALETLSEILASRCASQPSPE